MKKRKQFVGLAVFSGAGGMSLGAKMAGVNVQLAIEKDPYAAATYAHNHPETDVLAADISKIREFNIPTKDTITVLFGGPPCQGFSTSNQQNRSAENETNWLFKEFIRVVKLWRPDWVVFENVKGIIETEGGLFKDKILYDLEKQGYTNSSGILCSADFGVPQVQNRFFIIASKHGISVKMPEPNVNNPVSVSQALDDLPNLENGSSTDYLCYPKKAGTKYAKSMRNGHKGCRNHLVTANAPYVLERYKYIPQGGNWEDIPKRLMKNYTDKPRCHTGIYRRLREETRSVAESQLEDRYYQFYGGSIVSMLIVTVGRWPLSGIVPGGAACV